MHVSVPAGLALNSAVCFNTVQTAVRGSREGSWLVKTRYLLPSRVAASSTEVS